MNEHDELRADLVLHATGDLDAAAAARLDAHLAECEPCRRERAEIRATLGALRSLDEPNPLPAALAALPVVPAARPRRPWLRVAAALALFAGGLFAGHALAPAPGGSRVAADPAGLPPWCDESAVQRAHGLGQALLALKAARAER